MAYTRLRLTPKDCLAISLIGTVRVLLFLVRAQDGVYLENVAEQRVYSEAAVLDLISRGSYARSKGETQVVSNFTIPSLRLPTSRGWSAWLLIGRACCSVAGAL